jgi:hypothetical protein
MRKKMSKHEKTQVESESLLSMVEMLTSEVERNGVRAAFEDIRAGQVRTLAEIEADLEKK